jgi:hypothetical protein
MKTLYIGLTLHDCVRDLVNGSKTLAEVRTLIIGHKCVTEYDWQEAIRHGLTYYWSGLDEQEVRSCIDTLRTEGKILQPRLQKDTHYPIVAHTLSDRVVWVTSEKEIEWADA